MQECLAVDELRANPFAPRICELFSEDGSGSLTFTNFLDMKSAFSKKASPDVRVVWAFALWDFDGDDLIGRDRPSSSSVSPCPRSLSRPGQSSSSSDACRALPPVAVPAGKLADALSDVQAFPTSSAASI